MLQGRRGPAATASEPMGLLSQRQQFGYPELNRAIPTPPPGNANKGGADDGDNSSYFSVDAEATAVGVVHCMQNRMQKRTLKEQRPASLLPMMNQLDAKRYMLANMERRVYH